MQRIFDSYYAKSCKRFQGGKLFFCGREGALAAFEILAKKGEYLDFLNNERPVTREELEDFYYRKASVTAWNYCDGSDGHYNRVIPAGREQLKEPIRISGRGQIKFGP